MISQEPYSSSKLWELHQYYYSPPLVSPNHMSSAPPSPLLLDQWSTDSENDVSSTDDRPVKRGGCRNTMARITAYPRIKVLGSSFSLLLSYCVAMHRRFEGEAMEWKDFNYFKTIAIFRGISGWRSTAYVAVRFWRWGLFDGVAVEVFFMFVDHIDNCRVHEYVPGVFMWWRGHVINEIVCSRQILDYVWKFLWSVCRSSCSPVRNWRD